MYEWVHLLGPVLTELAKSRGGWDVLYLLFAPSSVLNRDLWHGYFFLLASLVIVPLTGLCVRAILDYWANATVPISVLETHLTLDLFDDLAHSRLTRSQLYHANREGQTAYFSSTSVNSSQGKVLRDTIQSRSTVDSESITKTCLITAGDRKVDIIELYTRPLPQSWLATVLPDSMVRFLYKSEFSWFKNVVVKRFATVENMHEYDDEEAHLSLVSSRYPVSNVKVTLRFPAHLAPDPSDMVVLVAKDNSGRPLVADESNNGDIRQYEIALSSFYQSTLHIFWKNRKLIEHKRKLAEQLQKGAMTKAFVYEAGHPVFLEVVHATRLVPGP